MKSQMFVIYDSKANAYMQPWFLTTKPMAIRAFTDCIADPKHNFGAHPEDYTLFDIGTFNSADAKIHWKTPVSIGNGIEFVQPDEKQLQLPLDEFGDRIAKAIQLNGPNETPMSSEEITEVLTDTLEDLT